ncbi:BSD domain-containing protein 1-A-like [Gossypium australe]|uniref:BSD domain-containing protein 1-A-like n=1 Tax=Gossypium australe TaxID=47621 RepID=A0A5B6WDR3_9ROSI|nr:BSD domain-containing protein 1-A-like [Gossypium australe]
MKYFADKKRSDRHFQVRDWRVFRQKLAHRYFGLFKVEAKIGEVAYRLQLPPDLRVHRTFHVSHLKRDIGQQPVHLVLPAMDLDGTLPKKPI